MTDTTLAEAKAAAAEAFAELASVTQAVAYHVAAASATRDLNAGTVTLTTTPLSLKGFVLDFTYRERQSPLYKDGDKKILLERATAEAAAAAAGVVFAPKLTDHVVLSGAKWELIGTREDPARATVELHVRRGI